MAHLAGWPTPTQDDSSNATRESGDYQSLTRASLGTIPPSSPAPTENGGGCLVDGWKTPAAQDPGITLERLVDKDGNPWTPGQRAYDKDTGRLAQTGLTQMVGCLAGWQTPQHGDAKGTYFSRYDENGLRDGRSNQLQGQVLLAKDIKNPKESPLRLNPHFSLWLMGYPTAWGICGMKVSKK
jgi:hypothetical protein